MKLAAVLWAAGAIASAAPPAETLRCKDCSVILISVTNLRYDHVSSNGYFRPTTPSLDALAAESLVFSNTFAQASWTLPGGISMFTGLYPFSHGVMNRTPGTRLPDKTRTLIDLLNQKGYRTAAFTGGFDYDPHWGLTSRFSHYEECKNTLSPAGGPPGPDYYGEFRCAVPKALEWLEGVRDKKFFLFLQSFDAHCPFGQDKGELYDTDYKGTVDFGRCLLTFEKTQPDVKDGLPYYSIKFQPKPGAAFTGTAVLGPEDVRHLIALYDEDVTFADKEIGRFLKQVKALGLEEKTIIIVTSEHGDMFGKHGRFMRGGPVRGTLYDDVIHVPLMIRHPKLRARRVDALVEQIDLMPTLASALALKPRAPLQGKNLGPAILEGRELHDYIFAGSGYDPGKSNGAFKNRSRIEAIRDKRYKLIRETVFEATGPVRQTEFYDILADADEMHDISGQALPVQAEMLKRLDERSAALFPLSRGGRERPSAGSSERLSRSAGP